MGDFAFLIEIIAAGSDFKVIFDIIKENGVTLVLLIFFIIENQRGKKGIADKLTELEKYERETMKDALEQTITAIMTEIKQLINSPKIIH